MHPQEHNSFGVAWISKAWHRTLPVTQHNPGLGINHFRKEIVASPVKVLHGDLFHSRIKQTSNHSVNIQSHFYTGTTPLIGQKFRGPVVPAAGTPLDVGDNENVVEFRSHIDRNRTVLATSPGSYSVVVPCEKSGKGEKSEKGEKEQLVRIVVDATYHDMPPLISGFFTIFGVHVPYHYLLIIIVSLSLLFIITLFINKSKLGKSIRAVAQDSEAASLMGINVDKILAYTLMISALLAAFAAILNVPVDIVAPQVGWTILLNSFAIVVLGGLGSTSGSVLGAYIIAFARSYTNYFLSPVLSALIPIIIIVLVLVLRPRGLLGKKEID